MKKYFSMVFIILTWMIYAQNIQITTPQNQTIEGVVIINSEGKMLGITDHNGEFPASVLENSSYIILNHRNLEQDSVWVKNILNQKIVVQKIREQNLPEVIINPNKDYITLNGYFNSYVINTGEFNIFIDGVMEVVLDRKTNKLKKTIVKEYRSFILENAKADRKVVSSFVFDNFSEIPKLKDVDNILLGKSEDNRKTSFNNEIDYIKKDNALTNKDLKIFGYVLRNLSYEERYSFTKSPATAKNWLQYKKNSQLELKHKSEDGFAKLTFFTNFYPQDISFKNKNEIDEGVKFNKNKSQYKTQYWLNEENASIYNTLSNLFKDNFKLQK